MARKQVRFINWIFSILILFFSNFALADLCTSVFPNGLQSTANGSLQFSACGTQLKSNPTTVLPFTSITNPSGCGTPTCQTANCSVNNTFVNVLNVSNFQTSSEDGGNITVSGTTTLDGHGDATTDYANVTVNSGGTLNFSPNSSGNTVYRITTLSVHGGGTVNLQPGDYWINTLTASGPSSSTAVFTVQGTGTARVFINTFSANNNNPMNWNVGGSASKLLIYSNSNINLNGTCNLKALIYSAQNIIFANSITVTGAMAAQSITLGGTSTVTYDSSSVSNMNFGPNIVCSGSAAVADCNGVFPDGAQCNSTNCQIIFNQCGNQIFNNPGNVLPAAQVINPFFCGSRTCNTTANCVASGTPGSALNYGAYQASNNTTTNITVSSNGSATLDGNNNTTTDYNNITVNQGATLNFSPNPNGTTTYRMNTLTVHQNGIVNFQPGDYWINSLNLPDPNGAVFNVVGTGTARLHVNNDINPANVQHWNNNGSASQLLIYTYGDFILNAQGSVVNAIIYAQGNAVIEDSASVTGAVAAQNVFFNDSASLTYDPNAVQNMDFGSICPKSNVGQFAVSAPSTGTNCQNITITVTAQNSQGHTVTNYTNGITITTQSSSGTWVSTTGGGSFSAGSNTGTATYQFVSSDNGVVSFQLSYPASGSSPITIQAFQTNNTNISGLSGPVNFIPTGILVTATAVQNPPTLAPPAFSTPQTSGNNFTMFLTAYNPSNCGIITSYTGAKNIRFWTSYVNPTSGTVNATINGTTIANSINATPTTQSITFNNGGATVTGKYTDVGQLTLNIQDTSTGGPSGVSGNFVVMPAQFAINIPGNSASQTTSQSACLSDSVFIGAGKPFTVNVQPQNSLGGVTPNYGNETSPQGITLQSSALIAPSPGRNGSNNDGAIGNASSFTKITGSAGPFSNTPYFTGSNFSFDEVGCINLTASVAGGSYLGAGNVSTSIVVGRFVPDHLDASGNAPVLSTGCSAGSKSFTYLDQPFLYSVPPILTIIARAAAGTTTQNYTGSFWKLANTVLGNSYSSQYYPVINTDVIPNLQLAAVNSAPVFADGGNGIGTFTFSDGGGFKIQRQNSTLVSPFTAEIQLRLATVIDSDGVNCTKGCISSAFNFGGTASGAGISFTGSNGGKQFFHGRMIIMNSIGSELLPLTVPIQNQYYTSAGGGFNINLLDSCTTFSGGTTNFILTPTTGVSTTPSLPSPATFQQGNLNLTLSTPNTSGTVAIEANLNASSANLPWLQFNWPYAGSTGGAYTADPRGVASFGIYKGNDRIIYEKEVFQ